MEKGLVIPITRFEASLINIIGHASLLALFFRSRFGSRERERASSLPPLGVNFHTPSRASSREMEQELVDRINRACKECLDEGKKEGMMALADALCEELRRKNLAKVERRSNDSLLFHPSNRFGAGLEPVDVWNLLKETAPRGFSWHKVKLARACQILPGNLGSDQLETNRAVAKKSGGLLPEPNSMASACAVACTHTVHTLKVIDHECKPPEDDPFWTGLLREDGRLSKEKFLEKFPSYREPLEIGLSWFISNPEVELKCPRWAGFLQEAGNADHGVERRVTNLALCMEAGRLLQRGRSIEQVAADMERFRPQKKGQVAYLARFAAKWGGGKSLSTLTSLDTFGKMMPNRRDIDAKQFGTLAEAKGGCRVWIENMMMALLASPSKYLKKDEAAMFDTKDVENISGSLKESPVNSGDRVFLSFSLLSMTIILFIHLSIYLSIYVSIYIYMYTQGLVP